MKWNFRVHVSRRANCFAKTIPQITLHAEQSKLQIPLENDCPSTKGLKMYLGYGKPENCINTFACQQQVTPYRMTKDIACRQQTYTLYTD